MKNLVTMQAPVFEARAVMPDNSFASINLSDYRGKYVILFFYPLDFTFVCPTEIIAFNEKLEEFEKRNCKVLGISVDSEYSHFAWKQTPVEKGGIGKINYPLISDITKKITREYGILHEDSVALRGLFLIDKNGIVRHQVVNDLSLGRDVNEALRVLEALQFTEEYGDVCPANWKPGEESIKPTPEGISKYLSDK
ncbi:MAG: peroxiredoxin [Vulcanimicrobiota bacterium]